MSFELNVQILEVIEEKHKNFMINNKMWSIAWLITKTVNINRLSLNYENH